MELIADAEKGPNLILRLTTQEIATLKAARKVCEAASRLMGETEDTPGDFMRAEVRLNVVLTQHTAV
jgi:hypothetical protein